MCLIDLINNKTYWYFLSFIIVEVADVVEIFLMEHTNLKVCKMKISWWDLIICILMETCRHGLLHCKITRIDSQHIDGLVYILYFVAIMPWLSVSHMTINQTCHQQYHHGDNQVLHDSFHFICNCGSTPPWGVAQVALFISFYLYGELPLHALCSYHQGWGLLSHFSPNLSALSKHTLDIKYHVYIWQVSPQLTCGDTWQIWMWFRKSSSYFFKIENFSYGEINERSFSNPHPRSVVNGCSAISGALLCYFRFRTLMPLDTVWRGYY